MADAVPTTPDPNEPDLEAAFGGTEPQAAQSTPPAAGAPPTAGTSPSVSSDLLSRAQAAGFELDGIDSDSKLANFLMDRYMAERPYADYGRQSLASPQPQQPGQPQSAQSAADGGSEEEAEFDADAHFNGLWSVPQLDDAAKFLIQNGVVQLNPETGLYEPKPGFETMALPVIQNLNQAHIAQKQNLQKFFDGNPYKAIYEAVLPALKHALRPEFETHTQSQFQQYQEQTFVEKFANDNKHWLYGADGKTLTADGQKFAQTVQELRAKGINDAQTLADYAIKLAGINTQPQQQTQQQAAPEVKVPAKDPKTGRFIPQEPKSKQETFIDNAKRLAAQTPSQQSFVQSAAEAYTASNEGDLDEMFTTALRQRQAA